jgi:hypothetical protein
MIASMNGHTAVIDTLLSHGVIANEKEEVHCNWNN